MSSTVFLSCVTGEFGTLRPKLARMVQRTALHVRHQDDFAHRGVLTLHKLEEEVCRSTAVFHVLGAASGSSAPAAQVEDFLTRHPEFVQRFADIAADGRAGKITYTQWEAWFALFFGKRLCIYQLPTAAPAPGQAAVSHDPAQETHVTRLRDRKNYPVVVPDVSELLEEIRVSLIDLHLLSKEAPEAAPCNLPYSPLGELFIGRGPFLADLRRRFEEARRKHPGVWPNHAVTGMAGVGKTRLAIEYAWQHHDEYIALLFVSAESAPGLDSQLANLAGVLRLGLVANAGDPDKRAAVLDWLRAHPGWLLIVDNVDDRAARDAVNAFLKDWHRGHVLITGRFVEWGPDVEKLGLHVLSKADAADFLLNGATERQVTVDDPVAARDLSVDLGGLCLALQQCTAYVNRLSISLSEYRQRWQENAKDVRAWADKVLMKYHEEEEVSLSVATTWQTTVQQLSAPARDLLYLLCWLAPAPIPMTLLDALEQALLADVEEAAAELHSYSLLQNPSQCGFETLGEVHRLVQLITRTQLTVDKEKTSPFQAIMRRVAQFFTRKRRTSKVTHASLPSALYATDAAFTGDPNDVRYWRALNALAPHGDEVTRHAHDAGIIDPTAHLMNQLGLLYLQQARFSEADLLFRSVVTIYEESLGRDHPNVATVLNNLAQVLQDKNRLAEAEPLMRRAGAIDERRFGNDHPNVARQLNNLAALLHDMGHSAEAERLMRRALAIDEESFGQNHHTVATGLNNLAQVLKATNRLLEAEPLMIRALTIDERCFGKVHPYVASDLSNLALLLQATNRLCEAEPLMRRALDIEERCYGKEHPKVATILKNLARLLQAAGRGAEAEPLIRRALAIGNHQESDGT